MSHKCSILLDKKIHIQSNNRMVKWIDQNKEKFNYIAAVNEFLLTTRETRPLQQQQRTIRKKKTNPKHKLQVTAAKISFKNYLFLSQRGVYNIIRPTVHSQHDLS